MTVLKCAAHDCDRSDVVGWGFCSKHYQRWKKYKDPSQTAHKETCTIEGCEKKHFGNGMCGMHYARVARHGSSSRKIREALSGTLRERLYKSFDVNPENGCWEWNRNLSQSGYGCMKAMGFNIKAHRLSYEIHKGSIPEGMFVCHSCDNRKCVNPNHLWIGTNKDNMLDMSIKGRGVKKKNFNCSEASCENIYYSSGYCKLHYSRKKRAFEKLMNEAKKEFN